MAIFDFFKRTPPDFETPQPRAVFEDFVTKKIAIPINQLGQDTTGENLQTFIEELKENRYFFHYYEGLTDQEIRQTSFEQPVYEITNDYVPVATIVKGDRFTNTATLDVLIGTTQKRIFPVGTLPMQASKQVLQLSEYHPFLVRGKITNGPYKQIDASELGDNKLITYHAPYGLEIVVSFFQEGGEEFLTTVGYQDWRSTT